MFYKFLFIIFYVSFFIIRETYSNPSLLLVLLYDGFRNEYLDRGITPTLSNFRYNGVHSDYLRTVYPALQIAAIHSISTGFYPQVHGYIMREDKLKGDASYYSYIKYNKEKYKISPIWELNQKNGGKTVCSMWNGMYNYTTECKCTHEIKYDRTTTLKKRVDDVIEKINVTVDIRPNLVLFYVEQLDVIGHFFGPLSRNSTLMIRRLDLLTKYIINKLIDIKIYHYTNIMILSDHGMRAAFADDILNGEVHNYEGPYSDQTSDDVNIRVSVGDDPVNVERYPSTINKSWKKARKNKKFTLVTIPPNNRSKLYIQYAACPGYMFDYVRRWSAHKFNNTYAAIYKNLYPPPKLSLGPFGFHGYLRQNDAIFMAKGPMFARFKKVEPFHMVDLYSAFTKLLNIKGQYENEGNFTRVLPIFTSHNRITWISVIVSIFALALLSTLLYFLIIEYWLIGDN